MRVRNSYMFVWYRGCNKAWCGYTGGVVYSRTPTLPPAALPAVKEVRVVWPGRLWRSGVD